MVCDVLGYVTASQFDTMKCVNLSNGNERAKCKQRLISIGKKKEVEQDNENDNKFVC